MNYSFYDEMDELNEILTETTDEEIFLETMMDLLGFNDPRYGIFMEKKTSAEYALKRFKEDYQYDPKTKTIVVDGNTYKANITPKGNLMCVIVNGKPVWTVNTTSTSFNNGEPTINIDSNFFKLKGTKTKGHNRQRAALQHEIGHAKLHSYNPSVETTDKRALTRDMLDARINDSIRELIHDLREKGVIKETDGYDNNEIARALADKTGAKLGKNFDTYARYTNMDARDRKIRLDARNAAMKYLPTVIDYNAYSKHTTAEEFEADRYAANKTDESSIKQATRESYKQTKKMVKNEIDLKNREHAKYLTQKNIKPSDRKTKDKFDYGATRKSMDTADTTWQANQENYKRDKRFNDEYSQAIENRDVGKLMTLKKPKQIIPKDRVSNNNKISEIDKKQRSKALKDKELRNNDMLK